MRPLLLAACAAVPDVDSAAPAPEPTPDLTAEEAGAILERALSGGLPEPWTPRDLYLSLLDAGDETCPGTDHILARPEFSCTSASGYTYYGVANYIDLATDAAESWQMETSSFVITAPDGSAFRSAGAWTFTAGAPFTGSLHGTVGRVPGDGWLATGPSVALDYTGTSDASGTTLTITGGLTSGGDTVWFDGVSTDDVACAGTLAGDVRVRSIAGLWYDLRFDTCGPCGDVSLEDLELGEACVDVAAPMLAALATLEAR